MINMSAECVCGALIEDKIEGSKFLEGKPVVIYCSKCKQKFTISRLLPKALPS